MRRLAIAVTLLLSAAGPAFAATAADFYVELLRKGVSEFNAERYDRAASMLRVAAFGLLETPAQYQTAQIYRAVAADRLNDAVAAYDAARRTLAAERVQKSYASLSLPAPVRTAFESVAKKALAPSELTMLTNGGGAAPPVQKATPQPAPVQEKTQPVKNPPAPAPAKTAPAKPEPAKAAPAKPAPKVETKPAPPPPKPVEPPRDVAAMLTSGERALTTGNLTEARKIYRQLLDGNLTHEQALRVAEGLHRARDFSYVLRAFERVGPLRAGEEPYGFYLAVAFYEMGRYAAAKKELAAAINHIELTPDVARYKTKIESATE